jgi:peptidoglycan/LPS O-acetylase OafA/YrhL
MSQGISRKNNFDLLRLGAALQVVITHSFLHLQLNEVEFGQVFQGILDFFLRIHGFFPGVPIFFVISGFLISMSWENNVRKPLQYAKNRILRIYPALWICFLVCLLLLFLCGYLTSEFVLTRQFFLWIVGQLTIVQFFNPDYLREFGCGVLNGSLWTIPVELQFYIVFPLIYVINRWDAKSLHHINLVLICVSAASFTIYCFIESQITTAGARQGAHILVKLLNVTIFPHFWMFAFGALIYKNFDRLRKFIEGKIFLLFLSFLILSTAKLYLSTGIIHYVLLFFARIVMALGIVSAAFSWKELADNILKRNDISYGIYVYHMPFVNLLIFLGMRGRFESIVWVLGFTVISAYLSWRFVEKPSLARKKVGLLWMDGLGISRSKAKS